MYREKIKNAIEQNPDLQKIGDSRIDDLIRYIENGSGVSGSLQAILENDLMKTYEKNDIENLRNLRGMMVLLYNYVPANAIGSKANVERWRVKTNPNYVPTSPLTMPGFHRFVKSEVTFDDVNETVNDLGSYVDKVSLRSELRSIYGDRILSRLNMGEFLSENPELLGRTTKSQERFETPMDMVKEILVEEIESVLEPHLARLPDASGPESTKKPDQERTNVPLSKKRRDMAFGSGI